MNKPSNAFSDNTKELIKYFVLSYAISWAIAFPLALQKQHIIQPIFPLWAHYFIGFGPMFAALIVSWHTQGMNGIQKMIQRILHWKVHLWWWLIAILPLLFGLTICFILNLVNDADLTLSTFGTVHFLPPLGIGALMLWIFTFGFGEEIGWRGYALPRLQKKYNALKATAILAVLWALWHLPQFFYLFDPDIAIGWAVGLFAGAIVFTWLFNSTAGSIPVVAVFHGSFNYITAAKIDNNIPAAVISTIVMIWAVVIIVLYKPKNLSTHKRVTADTLE